MVEFSLCCMLEGHNSPINCVSFGEGGYLATGCKNHLPFVPYDNWRSMTANDSHIILWSLAEQCEVLCIRPKQGTITSLKWVVSLLTSTEWFLLLGGANGTLQLRRLSNDKVIFSSCQMRHLIFDRSLLMIWYNTVYKCSLEHAYHVCWCNLMHWCKWCLQYSCCDRTRQGCLVQNCSRKSRYDFLHVKGSNWFSFRSNAMHLCWPTLLTQSKACICYLSPLLQARQGYPCMLPGFSWNVILLYSMTRFCSTDMKTSV